MKSLAMIEFNSIAKGMESADTMTKAAEVRLEEAKTICPGKYISLVSGDVAAVQASLEAGVALGGHHIVDQLLIPNVHPQVLNGLRGMTPPTKPNAVGVLEFFSVATSVLACDASAKAADVEIIELRLAMAIGGKSFYTITGDVSAVQAAVDAGAAIGQANGLLIHKAVIPSPTDEFFNTLL